MIVERALAVALLASLAVALEAGCVPGPAARCEAGSEEPWCPPSSESWLATRYEAVCGQARTDCSAGVRVVAPDGRPTCDPDAPELGPSCPGGWAPYCYFADCREGEDEW